MANANREQAYQNMLADVPEKYIPMVNSIPPLYYQMQDHGKFSIGVNEFTVMCYQITVDYDQKNRIIGWSIIVAILFSLIMIFSSSGEDAILFASIGAFIFGVIWKFIKSKNRDDFVHEKLISDLENYGYFSRNKKTVNVKENENPSFTYTRTDNNSENYNEEFDFDPSSFGGGKQANSNTAQTAPYGVDKRHPDDAKLWAIVDDPSSSDQERMTAFSMILKKQKKRKEGQDSVQDILKQLGIDKD